MPVKCEFCGAQYEKSPGKFCDKCGYALSRTDVEAVETDQSNFKRCLKCGHKNPEDAIVCWNCGERLYERQMI